MKSETDTGSSISQNKIHHPNRYRSWQYLNKSWAVLPILAAITLTACNFGDQDKATDLTTPAPSGDQVEVSAKADEPETSQVPDTVEGQGAGSGGSPVRYNVADWNNDRVEPIQIDELDKIQSAFGEVVSTDQNSLDYASNPATKYRFMANDEAYLDIIDSQKYLELGWYYANPSDSDEEKKISTHHAKKAYKFARQLMGEAGAKIVADILSGQVVKDRRAGDYQVELAKCEFYSCMLVMAKNKP